MKMQAKSFRKQRRKWIALQLQTRKKLGFSLLEMGIAISVMSLVLVTAISSVVSALHLQVDADRLALAMSLLQTKMAEIRSNPDLSSTDASDEITDSESIHYGYKWESSVEEDTLNVTDLLEGTLAATGLGEELPDGVQNQLGDKKESQKSTLFSLGDIPILRISLTVEYPKGKGAYGIYNVETLQRSKRSRIYQRR